MADKEVEETGKYEYLLVEYMKEISNEITYLLLVIVSLFLYILINLFKDVVAVDIEEEFLLGLTSIELLRIIFVILMIGGFVLFTLSNITKKNIEEKFEKIFKEK
ncbi:MAG: hypothetical protein ACOCTT_02010 [archaeon]